MEKILNTYYTKNAKKLHTMVDKILFKLRFHDVDNEDFYSLANEVFVDVIKRYDGKQDFDGFLYSSYFFTTLKLIYFYMNELLNNNHCITSDLYVTLPISLLV